MEIHLLGHRKDTPAPASNRTFGLVFSVFWAVIGTAPFIRHHPVRSWALIIAMIFLAAAVFYPRGLSWPNRIWTRFGAVIHFVVSLVALFGAYTVGVLPTAMMLRLMGKDPLRRKIDRTATSYWIVRGPHRPTGADMKNQF